MSRPIISERTAVILSVGSVISIVAWHDPTGVGMVLLLLFAIWVML